MNQKNSLTYIFSINDIELFIEAVVQHIYDLTHVETHSLLVEYFSNFRNDIWCYAEFPYVEKYFRDNYYNFYSTKHRHYDKDCVRISLFNSKISESYFRDKEKIKLLKEKDFFLGCINIRPTVPAVIGRSIINLNSLRDSEFNICTATYKFMINGVRLTTVGFPHSMQDYEATRCAEISVCNLMDYFSSKYSEYRFVLPSYLRKIINNTSEIRQLPSDGLRIQNISYALKEFGFEPVIYYRKEPLFDKEFDNLICAYIESAIPVIGVTDLSKNDILQSLTRIKGVTNSGDETSTESIDFNDEIPEEISKQHTFLIIGKKKSQGSINLKELVSYNLPVLNSGGNSDVILFDYNDLIEEMVISDDGRGPYSVLSLRKPSGSGTLEDILNSITGIVVPLPQKVYMDASKAKDYAFNLVSHFIHFGHLTNKQYYLRTFLTSSRSFKEHINNFLNINLSNMETLINFPTPKYIWVCELFVKTLKTKTKCIGFFVMDSTESNELAEIHHVMLFAVLKNKILLSDLMKNDIKSIPLHSIKNWGYSQYSNFLKND